MLSLVYRDLQELMRTFWSKGTPRWFADSDQGKACVRCQNNNEIFTPDRRAKRPLLFCMFLLWLFLGRIQVRVLKRQLSL